MITLRNHTPHLKKACTIATILLAFYLVPSPQLLAHQNDGPLIDIHDFAREADFIFKGTVLSVEYKNSERNLIVDADGQNIELDGSNLPHTFVTFYIDEIFKGKAPEGPTGGPPSETVTLRFVGGQDVNIPDEFVLINVYPLFDVGDQDILFVKHNTIRPCPLVNSGYGRFRVIYDQGSTAPPHIFSDVGYEIVHVPADDTHHEEGVDFGPLHILPETTINTIGHETLERRIVDERDEFDLPDETDLPEPDVPKGPQFTELQFVEFVQLVIEETHTPEELRLVPPVDNANIGDPFIAETFFDSAPPTDQPEEEEIIHPRPWLDELPPEDRLAILEAEQLEIDATEANGGNPVIPDPDSCRELILNGERLTGDICGPEGEPDCKVDMYDFTCLARNWLDCVYPNDCGELLD